MARLFALGPSSMGLMMLLAGAAHAEVPQATPNAPAPPPAAVPAPGNPPSPDRGRFGALWVTPLATHHFQGAGLEAGYRYSWLAGVYRVGILQNGYEPSAGGALRRTQRFLLELELDAQIRLWNPLTLAVGAGGALMSDHVDTASPGALDWNTTTEDHARIRALASAMLVGPVFETGVTVYVESHPEIRLVLGVCLGRNPRRPR